MWNCVRNCLRRFLAFYIVLLVLAAIVALIIVSGGAGSIVITVFGVKLTATLANLGVFVAAGVIMPMVMCFARC